MEEVVYTNTIWIEEAIAHTHNAELAVWQAFRIHEHGTVGLAWIISTSPRAKDYTKLVRYNLLYTQTRDSRVLYGFRKAGGGSGVAMDRYTEPLRCGSGDMAIPNLFYRTYIAAVNYR